MQEVWHALKDGAPFSFINMTVLAFALAVVAERFLYIFTKYKVNTAEFMAQIRKLVEAGNIDRAVKLCSAAPLPLLQVIGSGLKQHSRGEDAVLASIEEKMAEVIPALEKRISSLWTLANLATLLGLLGTIRGLIRAFAAAGLATNPAEKTAKLSQGISEAMWNTFFGLLIAVTCMFFHLILSSMASKHKHEMEKATLKLENLITLRKN